MCILLIICNITCLDAFYSELPCSAFYFGTHVVRKRFLNQRVLALYHCYQKWNYRKSTMDSLFEISWWSISPPLWRQRWVEWGQLWCQSVSNSAGVVWSRHPLPSVSILLCFASATCSNQLSYFSPRILFSSPAVLLWSGLL